MNIMNKGEFHEVRVNRHLEVQKDVYICLLCYEKAFERVRHVPFTQTLSEICVDGKDIRIIRNLYFIIKST